MWPWKSYMNRDLLENQRSLHCCVFQPGSLPIGFMAWHSYLHSYTQVTKCRQIYHLHGCCASFSTKNCMPFADFQQGCCDKICRITAAVHPGRLRWNKIIGVWKISFLSKWVICRFHVNLPGCNMKKTITKTQDDTSQAELPWSFFGGRNFRLTTLFFRDVLREGDICHKNSP